MNTTPKTVTDGTRRLLNRMGESSLLGWLLPYTRLDIPETQWEEQYRNGAWDRLNDLGETGRYGVIAAYCRSAAPGSRILDVGCGEGILLDHIAPQHHRYYTGIDISSTTIATARQRHASGNFLVADSNEFTTTDRFDAVVFNECLYYFDNPEGLMKRYATLLDPDGIIVVSAYVSPRTRRFWSRLRQHGFTPGDEVELKNAAGNRWTVRLYRRQSRP